jgi:hypothetical protein
LPEELPEPALLPSAGFSVLSLDLFASGEGAYVANAVGEPAGRDLTNGKGIVPSVGPFGRAADHSRHLKRHQGIVWQLVELLETKPVKIFFERHER